MGEPALKPARMTTLPSAHQIGDLVSMSFGFTEKGTADAAGMVVAVTFRPGKVTYDVELHGGGQTLENVDSCFVMP